MISGNIQIVIGAVGAVLSTALKAGTATEAEVQGVVDAVKKIGDVDGLALIAEVKALELSDAVGIIETIKASVKLPTELGQGKLESTLKLAQTAIVIGSVIAKFAKSFKAKVAPPAPTPVPAPAPAPGGDTPSIPVEPAPVAPSFPPVDVSPNNDPTMFRAGQSLGTSAPTGTPASRGK